MGSDRLITHQLRQYESSYRTAESEYGFPDRKIADGATLRGKRLLSVGSGTASDLWYLAPDNLIVAADYSPAGLTVARRHGVLGLLTDLNMRPSLPFRDQSFDIVICKDILEHLVEPIEVLWEVRRVLRNDGYAIINVPNHFYWRMRFRLLLGKGLIYRAIGADHAREYEEWNYMHMRFFTFKGFQRFLGVAGFHSEKWFWDFGTLAHYCNPDMWLEPQRWKKATGSPISTRGRFGLYVLAPLWKLLNGVLPPSLRGHLVGLAPGLFCASFYVRVRKA